MIAALWPPKTGAGGIGRVPRSIAAVSLLVFILAAGTAPLSPLFDPDEGYYPATAAETLRNGAFWDLRFNGAPRWDKPILSYALIESAFEIFGESVTAARLPSAIEGAALIAIIGGLVARLAGARAGVLATVVVGSTMGVSIFSRAAHPEIAVVLSIMSTELLLCVRLTTPSVPVQRRTAVVAGISVAYGVLAKGPIAVVLPLLALLCALPAIRLPRAGLFSLLRHASLTAVIALMLALPWYAAMSVRHGSPFLTEGVWRQNVGRYATEAYGHRAAVLLLPLATLLGLLPWVGFLPQAVRHFPARTRSPRDVLRVVTFASAVSALVFYSVSSSKLPSYSLVCVPAFGILIALWIDDQWDRPAAMRRAWFQLIAVFAGVAVTLLSASAWVNHVVTTRQLLGGLRPQASDVGALLAPVTIPLGLLTAVGVVLLVTVTSTKFRLAVVAAVGMLAPVLVLTASRPLLQTIYPWQALARHIQPGQGPVWLLNRRAPSLPFYARQTVTTVPDLLTLEAEVQRAPEGWLLVTRDDWARLTARESSNTTTAAIVAQSGRMVLVRFTHLPSARSLQ